MTKPPLPDEAAGAVVRPGSGGYEEADRAVRT